MFKIVSTVTGLAAVTAAAITLGANALAAPAHDTGAASLPHTVVTVVRPVHANGTPVHGYRVTTEHIQSFFCDSGASPSAVDSGIRYCGFSATYTVSCWKSTSHTVLCLRNAQRKALVRIHYSGSFAKVAAPKHPVPQAMTLRDANACSIRDGGAWDTVIAHPNWYGSYSCSHYDLYGPANNNGIDESANPWLVHVVRGYSGSGHQSIAHRRVADAYFVGTAA